MSAPCELNTFDRARITLTDCLVLLLQLTMTMTMTTIALGTFPARFSLTVPSDTNVKVPKITNSQKSHANDTIFADAKFFFADAKI